MEFVGYETCEKLIWKSGEGYRNTHTISKQGIPRSNMNMTSPSSKLGFSCSLHKETFDILKEDLVSHRFQEYSSKNDGNVLRYINKVCCLINIIFYYQYY